MKTPPNRMCFDIEIAAPIKKKAGRLDMAAAVRGGISVIGCWPVDGLAPQVWLADWARLPAMAWTEEQAAQAFAECEGTVTWNGANFDNRILKKCAPPIRQATRGGRHVDLMATCALLQADVDPHAILDLDENWKKLAPAVRDDFLQAGWGLDAVAKATLGIGKTKGFDGAQAPIAWQDGKYSEVISYCLTDVALTRLLYIHAWEHGWLESEERGRCDVPREVL